jgi:2-polyprenyl-3-methyl-5-hydroxy-6-metoxy-1,4-benzoquinol methylase
MKLKAVGENLLEHMVLALGLAPVTLVDTHMAFLRARAIMVATKLGLFDALSGGALAAVDVATRCDTAPAATAKLLNALVGAGYLTCHGSTYSLAAVARKWVTSDSPTSIRDKVLFEFVEWQFVERVEEYVRTGQPLDMHLSGMDGHWDLYQRAMRTLAGLTAPELVSRLRVPAGATTLLDIGGSHGFTAVALCRKHPALSATILDLPSAIVHAAPILAKEAMGVRVVHRIGNALSDDLGREAWDVVHAAQLVHHFDAPTNAALVKRIAEALRPAGLLAIVELIRPAAPHEGGQMGALLDLYFALTSQSGTWSTDEITGWQRDAGLTPKAPIRLRTAPGVAAVVAVKPR